MQGKGPRAFSQNIKTEMHSGKPQKQALAIAYAVRRRAAHKAHGGKIKHMSEGGEMQEPEISQDENLDQKQAHVNEKENYNPQPLSEKEKRMYEMSEKFNPSSGQMFAHGGMANKMIQRKAMGGEVENEMLHPEHEPEHPFDLSEHADEHLGFKAQEHEDLDEPEEFREHIEPASEDLPVNMLAHGGIAKAIIAKRINMHVPHGLSAKMNKYAEGGPVDEMGLNDQEMDTDHFMSEFHEPEEMDHMTALDMGEPEEIMNKEKRKSMLSKIMANLHREHMGR